MRCTLGDITVNFSRRNKEEIHYPMFSVTNNKGFIPQSEQFEDREMIGEDIKAYKIIHKDDFAYNPARINVGSIAKYNEENPCMISSLYVCFKTNPKIDNDWMMQLLKTPKMNFYYNINGEGGVRIYLFYPNFARIKTSYPTLKEQQKISSFLTLLDERISTQNKIIEDLKKLKVAIRDKQLNAIRKHYGLNYQICDLLDYEQPTKYVVTDSEYSEDRSKTPVLTANKAFILGYTDENFGVYDNGACIILDDFTLDCKYVDFPFKVKSSAIKILTVKSDCSLRYVYEYLNYMNLETIEHKRHYISEIEPMIIAYPTDKKRIDDFNSVMSSFERKIEIENKYFQSLLTQKDYLLSNLFI